MAPDDRIAKKVREARMLREVPPARSLEMAFSLSSFANELHEAGDRA